MALNRLDEPLQNGERQRLLLLALDRAGCLEPGTQPGRFHVDDWDTIQRFLERHGLASLALAAFAKGSVSPPCPPEQLARLKRVRHQGLLVHRTALQALERIHPLFVEAGLPYAVLKGPHLQEALYSADFPRLYGDVDLLVRRDQVQPALALLQKAGYHPASRGITHQVLQRIHFHLLLRPADKGLPKLELHWSLVDRANLYRISDEEALARACECQAGAVRFRVLSPEDTLIYLCLHLVKHGVLNSIGLRSRQPAPWYVRNSSGNRLLWCLDIALLLHQEWARMRGETIRQRSADWNVTVEVTETLRVVDLLIPSLAARRALQDIEPQGARRHRESSGRLDRWLQTRKGLQVLEALMTMHSRVLFRPVRLFFLGRLFFPSPDTLRAYYGPSSRLLAWLYLQHPFHMARKLIR